MTGIVILAAGSSSRLGKPKQNLIYKDKTLLQRTINAALETGCLPVIVVLGANADLIKPIAEDLPVEIIYNDDWEEGMSSSIRAGINALQKNETKVDSVILMLCDQPFVDAEILKQLIPTNSAKNITASAYNRAIGPPVFFDGYYFPELLLLQGNEGAKKLMLKYEVNITTIPFLLGSVDIDTTEDYENLKQNS
ncbi:nucleotidyltransferase family protein [Mucilaginibacter sp. BJC16-A38]|uniref:nucleotidyltransferase family protein n=1 Tax=Mucilaginibacter phenanthrenivorans TaxID=1234842 RepID=UPI002157AED3|nr:nucleotidyltransferase family protein [Mucilaginibacter phenanthrenivorans]MCR8556328.1 nucleotidyltransferase family protein [Mucilaginibacter phenanthrenivorans]